MKPSRFPGSVALLSVVVAAILLLVPLASAGGSGYSLTYSRAGGASSNSNVDLISLTTSPSGATVSVTFQVSGTLVLNSPTYFYYVLFGGGGVANATAYAYFSDSVLNGTYISGASGGYGFGPLPFTTGNGGSSLTFSINQSAVGPASSFTANAWAVQGTDQSGSYSYLGTNYLGIPPGGTCTANSCTSTSSGSTISGGLLLGIIGGVVVLIIVVVLVVVLVVMPRRKAPPQTPPPMAGGGMAPPPPMTPPPPQ